MTNHKTVGLHYAVTALGFLFVGFLLMLIMRWQLAWPTSTLPSVLATVVGEANAPGGYMVPEFYNQLVAMHGTVMIFLAVVPLLTGAFGNYLIPLQIGTRDMAFPRLNAANVITTVVQLRAEGLTFMRLPFFVWSQFVAALLLLLAFPSL